MPANVAASDKVVLVLRAREVDEAAGIEERRARDADVHFLAPLLVEAVGLLAELRSAHDRVVAEYEAAVLDEPRYRDELHRRHLFALALVLRHERPRPSRRVLHERTGELDARLVRVAERMRSAGVGDPACGVDRRRIALRERRTAAIARHLDVASLVGRRRIAVVDPEERADRHLVARFDDSRHAIRRHLDHFAGAEVADIFVAEVRKSAAFHKRDHPRLLAANHYRSASVAVARRVEPSVARDKKKRAAALHLLLNIANAGNERVLSRDQRGDHLRRADHSARRRVLQLRVVLKELLLDLLDVRNKPDSHYRERAELRVHHERLRIGVGYDADADIARKARNVMLKLRTERRVLDVVNRPLEAAFPKDGHAATMGAEV